MNAALRKIKSDPKKQKKPMAARPAEVALDQKMIMDAWASELEQFSTQSFASLDEARSALIAAVVARLEVPAPMGAQISDFLEVTLSDATDIIEILSERVRKR